MEKAGGGAGQVQAASDDLGFAAEDLDWIAENIRDRKRDEGALRRGQRDSSGSLPVFPGMQSGYAGHRCRSVPE